MNSSDFNAGTEPQVDTNEIGQAAEALGSFYKIGHMAKQYQVTLRTLRFYECSGLLHPKRQGMTRLYSLQDCQRLEMILRGRQLGFSLAAIHDLIQTGDDAVKVTDLESALGAEQILIQIQNLEKQRADLDKAISALRSAHERIYKTNKIEYLDESPSPF